MVARNGTDGMRTPHSGHAPPTRGTTSPPWPGAVENPVGFGIGPEGRPAEAMGWASTMELPRFMEGAPRAEETCPPILTVLTGLVDVTARRKAGIDLVCATAYGGAHRTVSAGDMVRMLPEPEEEPSLCPVRRLAVEVGRCAHDHGERIARVRCPVDPGLQTTVPWLDLGHGKPATTRLQTQTVARVCLQQPSPVSATPLVA
jgi:hypothetical protein